MGLQEDFDEQNHDLLTADSTHDVRLRFGEPLETRFYGSGLSILSRFELLDHQHHHYNACNGRFDSASDWLRRVFRSLVFVSSPGMEVDVYNSHLEAGNSAEDDVVRSSHVDEILNVMTNYSAGRALIFLADTNLHADQPTDATHLRRLEQTADLIDACESVSCPQPGRIDRIMYRD